MVRINLRDYYPFYKSDFFVEVTNEILELFKQLNRKEHADFERRRVYKAYYSLDADEVLKRMSSCWFYPRKKSMSTK